MFSGPFMVTVVLALVALAMSLGEFAPVHPVK
jgi:hypothetical protein